jgi:hypothetical protein
MEISTPNENGCLQGGVTEVVAYLGRSQAVVTIARGPDGAYRFSVGLTYSYGGFSGPITMDDEPYPTRSAARDAGLAELLRRWHKPFESDPESVHDELRILRDQIESQLRQPSLF